MTVGFTGTRAGMSQQQEDQLAFLLGVFGLPAGQAFHYSTHAVADLKADRVAAAFAARFGYRLVPHHAERGDELARDRRLVAASDVLIAAPRSDSEELRSGTWATIRYMQELRRPVVLLSRGARAKRRG